ncbi:hypothetical protein ACOME3_007752 [Neoechinorhynchus agilis]
MRLNENISLSCGLISLVPYKSRHVATYHKWMQNEDLLKKTGSERLSIEQEFAMQHQWLLSEDKLRDEPRDLDEVERMIGDINAFINDKKAELSIMIARPEFRRRGYARLALKIMMHFISKRLCISTFIAKVKKENECSLALFKNIGFTETRNCPNFFGEIELIRTGDCEHWCDYSENIYANYCIVYSLNMIACAKVDFASTRAGNYY